jgi:nucleoside-diphosphate-sugar epimerase
VSRETIRAINIDGTLDAFRAAAAAGAKRFVYASSVAAYGFHRDNPERITEEWPTRPGSHLFYAQEKAELERLLHTESQARPELELYLLRPPIVLGPHAVGAKDLLPEPLAQLGRRLGELVRSSPVPLPVLVPSLSLQFIHEDDVGQAFLQCIVAAGPPGAYNITGDGVLTGTDVARELGLAALPVPAGLTSAAARALTRLSQLPFLPRAVEWVEVATRPSIMDASKAKRELDWRPRYTSLEALRDTIAAR